eukprot:PhF_6_TR2297/c0_g1_i2/m.4028
MILFFIFVGLTWSQQCSNNNTGDYELVSVNASCEKQLTELNYEFDYRRGYCLDQMRQCMNNIDSRSISKCEIFLPGNCLTARQCFIEFIYPIMRKTNCSLKMESSLTLLLQSNVSFWKGCTKEFCERTSSVQCNDTQITTNCGLLQQKTVQLFQNAAVSKRIEFTSLYQYSGWTYGLIQSLKSSISLILGISDSDVLVLLTPNETTTNVSVLLDTNVNVSIAQETLLNDFYYSNTYLIAGAPPKSPCSTLNYSGVCAGLTDTALMLGSGCWNEKNYYQQCSCMNPLCWLGRIQCHFRSVVSYFENFCQPVDIDASGIRDPDRIYNMCMNAGDPYSLSVCTRSQCSAKSIEPICRLFKEYSLNATRPYCESVPVVPDPVEIPPRCRDIKMDPALHYDEVIANCSLLCEDLNFRCTSLASCDRVTYPCLIEREYALLYSEPSCIPYLDRKYERYLSNRGICLHEACHDTKNASNCPGRVVEEICDNRNSSLKELYSKTRIYLSTTLPNWTVETISRFRNALESTTEFSALRSTGWYVLVKRSGTLEIALDVDVNAFLSALSRATNLVTSFGLSNFTSGNFQPIVTETPTFCRSYSSTPFGIFRCQVFNFTQLPRICKNDTCETTHSCSDKYECRLAYEHCVAIWKNVLLLQDTSCFLAWRQSELSAGDCFPELCQTFGGACDLWLYEACALRTEMYRTLATFDMASMPCIDMKSSLSENEWNYDRVKVLWDVLGKAANRRFSLWVFIQGPLIPSGTRLCTKIGKSQPGDPYDDSIPPLGLTELQQLLFRGGVQFPAGFGIVVNPVTFTPEGVGPESPGNTALPPLDYTNWPGSFAPTNSVSYIPIPTSTATLPPMTVVTLPPNVPPPTPGFSYPSGPLGTVGFPSIPSPPYQQGNQQNGNNGNSNNNNNQGETSEHSLPQTYFIAIGLCLLVIAVVGVIVGTRKCCRKKIVVSQSDEPEVHPPADAEVEKPSSHV